MDFLIHSFLPITVAIIWWLKLLYPPLTLVLAGLGLLRDFDKFLKIPGLTHSLTTLAPVSLAALGAEYWYRSWMWISIITVALTASYLFLDFVNRGPVPLLFPFIQGGVRLEYPIQTGLISDPPRVWWEGPPVTLRTTAVRPGYNAYGLIKSIGVSNTFIFMVIYCGAYSRPTLSADRGKI